MARSTQAQMVAFLERYFAQQGYPPSVREIGAGIGISSSSLVHYHLKRLEKRGVIVRTHEVARGINLGPRQQENAQGARRVPLIGRIAAGAPIEPIEDANPDFVSDSIPEGCYALRVTGKSMIDDHIDDGDIVVVRPNPSPENGAVVVAVIADGTEHGGATLKRFYRCPDGCVRLQPRNPSMEPIVLPAESVAIRGQVVRVVRDFL